MSHPADVTVKNSANADVTITPPAAFGRAAAADSKPVAASTEDKAVMDAQAASLVTVATAQGASGTGITQPTGGSGLMGWLSGIYAQALLIVTALGTNLASLVTVTGAQADTVAASDTATASLIALTKRMLQNTTALNTTLQAALPAGANLIGSVKVANTAGTAIDPATSTKQPALGTAGTPSTDVLTVQGASTGTPLNVQGFDAAGAAATKNPLQAGGVVKATSTTLTDGWVSPLTFDAFGNLKVALYAPGAVSQVPWNAPSIDAVPTTSSTSGSYFSKSLNFGFNGTTFDRLRNNIDTAALVTLTAAGAGTTNSADQVNYNGRGVNVIIDITAATSMTLTVSIQVKDAASGKYVTALSSTALAATGTTMLSLYPGITATANASASALLSRTWRVVAVVTGTSVTATVGASVIL